MGQEIDTSRDISVCYYFRNNYSTVFMIFTSLSCFSAMPCLPSLANSLFAQQQKRYLYLIP